MPHGYTVSISWTTSKEDLVFLSSLQSIGDNCFALCSKLQQITLRSTTPTTIEAKTFYDVKRTIPVYVPEGALESYKADIYWCEFWLIEGELGTALPEILNGQTGCYTVLQSKRHSLSHLHHARHFGLHWQCCRDTNAFARYLHS